MKGTIRLIGILGGLGLGVELVTRLVAEIIWFQEVGYLLSFFKRLFWEFGLCSIITGISAIFILKNIRIAQRFQWHSIPKSPSKEPQRSFYKKYLESYSSSTLTLPKTQERLIPQSVRISLPWLLLIVTLTYMLVGLMLSYYSQLAIQALTPNFNLPNVTSSIGLPRFIQWILKILPSFSNNILTGVVLVLIMIALGVRAEFWLQVIAFILSLLFGLFIAGNWTTIISYIYQTPFQEVDAQFGKEISFYIFNLPFLQVIYIWFTGLFIYSLAAVSLIYLLSAKSLSEGKFPGFSRPQLRHLYALWGGVMSILALYHVLRRYELLYSSRGVIYGAGYTDVYIQQYIEIGLGIVAVISAFWLFSKAITGATRQTINSKLSRLSHQKVFNIFRKNWYRMPFYLWFILLYIIIFLAGNLSGQFIQMVWVEPNELAREKPYIERSIFYTRKAFNLDKIDAKIFDPQGNLTLADLEKNRLTIDNIRLWDTQPLLQTNRQLQQIRSYYQFPSAAIDRYLMKVSSKELQSIDVPAQKNQQKPPQNLITEEKQQVIIAARELDYNAVPQKAQTWVNKHLTYTHGYGFTLSPVNLVAQGGLPYYFVKDIGTLKDQGALRTSSELIQYSIPITKPRIYYGQLTKNYIMTSTKVKELDFPSGQENAYTTYDGTGGIKIGLGWKRQLFSIYLKDWQMLFTRDFTSETQLLFRRTIDERIRQIAPFLQYDREPYLVVADLGEPAERKTKNTLYWMVDAYTISDHYPYSDPGQNKFNYIRNSVKVVIDAYNGDVNFYIADNSDPLIQTWKKIFPNLFQSLEDMPAKLRAHIRYPEDLFSTQSERLLTYHMIDPQVFYNREDLWQIPKEIYGTESQSVIPYYLIMKLPSAEAEEFILLQPYTPRSRSNLIAWLAARSDGQNYGKLLLYQFPKQKLVYGTNQIEALINQDPAISQQISLWNREGSRVLQGNLLIIPIEESLLYVEPLYLAAEENSVPTLARVIVFYQDQIVMAETLKGALQAIFAPDKSSPSAIVRPVEDL